MTNFKDQFTICITIDRSCRYSFVKDKWEKLPHIRAPSSYNRMIELPFKVNDLLLVGACSLGDKVYVIGRKLDGPKYCIGVLYNPDASFFSLDRPHW